MTCPNCGCEHLLDPEGPGWECYKTVQLPGETRRFKLCRNCGTRVRTSETIEKVLGDE